MPIRPKTPGYIGALSQLEAVKHGRGWHGFADDRSETPHGEQFDGPTSAQVETNLAGSLLKIAVGSQEVWLTRDEALEVLGLLPGAINQMPFEI